MLAGDPAPAVQGIAARASFDDVRMQARLQRRMFGTSDDPVQLGRYRIDELIGRGGMGSVYAAHDPELDRRVAIKLLSSTAGGDRIRAVRREARALAALSHPNVVQVYEIGEADGRPFVVMELVDGESLAQWLARHGEPTRERFHRVRELLLQTGRGLAAAHAVGLVHRDVKPSNVLVGRDGRVRVADFGLAWLRDTSAVTQPRGESESTGASRPAAGGTPAYMAPEQFDRGDVDAAADQYAFCVTAFEAFYGQAPFASSNPFVARGDVVVPMHPGVPRWIGPVILRGLATDRSERFATMDELLQRMARRGSRVPALALGLALAGAVAAVVGSSETTPPPVDIDPCASDGASVGDWWSADVSDRVTDAFVRANAVDAVQVATAVSSAMTAYAHRFEGEWQRACTTTDDDARAARLACLDGRRAEAGALVDQLLHSDAAVVDNAANAVAQLSDPEPCGRLDRSTIGEVAHDGYRRAASDALARSIAAASVGRAPEAVAWAAAAEAMAAASGADDLRARALVRLSATSDGPHRIPSLERAWALASRAHDDQAAAEAALLLVATHGSMPDDSGQALMWRGHAEASLLRLGDDTELQAAFYETLAEHAEMRGNHGEALEFTQRSLAEYDRMIDHPRDSRARTTVSMAQALAGLGNELAAIEAYRAGLLLMELSGVQHHVDWAVATTKYAAALARAGAFVEAEVQYRRGLAALRVVPDASPRMIGVVTSDFGQGLFTQGRFADAIVAYEEALQVFSTSDEVPPLNVGTVQVNLGHALRFAGELSRARASYERAVVILEVEKAAVYHCRALVGIGEIELAEHRPAKALAAFARARAILVDEQPGDLLPVLLGEAEAQLQLGHRQLARRAIDDARRIEAAAELPPHRVAGIRLREARVAAAFGEHDAAIASYSAATELFVRAQPYATGHRADAHWELAQLLSRLHRDAEAREQAALAAAAWDALPERYAAESSRARQWLESN